MDEAEQSDLLTPVPSESLFRRIVETSRAGVWLIDTHNTTLFANPQLALMLGCEPENMVGRPAFDFMDEEFGARVWQKLQQLNKGAGEQFDVRLKKTDGSVLWAIISATSLLDESKNHIGALGIVTDISSRVQLELEREALLSQLRASIDRNSVVRHIAAVIRTTQSPEVIQREAITYLGKTMDVDRCYFSIYDVERDYRWIAEDYRRPELPSVAGEYRISDYQVNVGDYYSPGNTLVVIDREKMPIPAPLAALLTALQIRSAISVPLFNDRQQLSATLSVAMANTTREWSDDEVLLVEDVASEIRIAVEAAQLTYKQSVIAQQLQDALIPPIPRNLTGLALASFYQAGSKEAGVGGDFNDVFELPGMRTALIVGDVSGRGLRAAAQIATLRNMLRYAVFRGRTLTGAVTSLNEVLCRQRLLSGFATLFVGEYSSVSGILKYVNCGQEPALLFRPSGIDRLEGTGPVLGAIDEAVFDEAVVSMCPGDIVAIFTDGLTECGPDRLNLLGIDRVAEIFAGKAATVSHLRPDQQVDSLISDLVSSAKIHSQGEIGDDICLLLAAPEAA